ncbi:16S rRNA (guanine(527)-N(7))-methyltransferase RsmG [Pasteuria penetrans]|uniref:16S rRNA (guanine(527)-N(7))-methyltransferase RsmG n=1 Tax=Pasteuria penetrans TaxID=86005 RepID=UPI0011EBF2A6|nr:16S rRNA (guanine(527)-N(7))-methyltransferase RsmG [Pasteuria penetrans]
MNPGGQKLPVHEEFRNWCKRIGLKLSDKDLSQFAAYADLIREGNKRCNLTRILDDEGMYSKHFYDSLALCQLQPLKNDKIKNLLDVGSGAGFPSIPIKIVSPDLRVTTMDARSKKVSFLQTVCQQLALSRVECLVGRAEKLAHNPSLREAFDMVVARALAPLPVLLEYTLPFVRRGGIFVIMKGPPPPAMELKAVESVLWRLGGNWGDQLQFSLPHNHGERTLFTIKKEGVTPSDYPRAVGVPTRHPLV